MCYDEIRLMFASSFILIFDFGCLTKAEPHAPYCRFGRPRIEFASIWIDLILESLIRDKMTSAGLEISAGVCPKYRNAGPDGQVGRRVDQESRKSSRYCICPPNLCRSILSLTLSLSLSLSHTHKCLKFTVCSRNKIEL